MKTMKCSEENLKSARFDVSANGRIVRDRYLRCVWKRDDAECDAETLSFVKGARDGDE